MTGAKSNILEAIGHTPIVKLQKVARHVAAEIYVKCEYLNPGGSMKDRVARNIIEDAERRGLLEPGGTIVEATSGNTGMGAGAGRGAARLQVRLRDARQDVAGEGRGPARVRRARRHLPDRRRARRPAQLLPGRQAHRARRRRTRSTRTSTTTPPTPRRTTSRPAPEIWEQTRRRGRRVRRRHGHGRHDQRLRASFFKEKKPGFQLVGVDPVGSLYYDFVKTGRMTQARSPTRSRASARTSFPSTMNLKIVDEIVRVDDKECFLMTRELVRQEGLFVGGGSRRGGRGRDQVRRGEQAQGEHPGAAPRRRVTSTCPRSSTTSGCARTASSTSPIRWARSSSCCARRSSAR